MDVKVFRHKNVATLRV